MAVSSLEMLCNFCSKSFARSANFFRKVSLILYRRYSEHGASSSALFASGLLANLRVDCPTPRRFAFEKRLPSSFQIRQCQSCRWDIVTQAVCLQLRLHVAKKCCEVLALCHPRPLRGLLVYREFG